MTRPIATVLLALFVGAHGYSVLPQRASYFVGRDVLPHHHGAIDMAIPASVTSAARGNARGARIEMKKGKPNLPPAMRSQYARAKEMESYRQQMMEAQRYKPRSEGGDGLPVFSLFVRGGVKNVSRPIADDWICGPSMLFFILNVIGLNSSILSI